jgi:hypothetical protein
MCDVCVRAHARVLVNAGAVAGACACVCASGDTTVTVYVCDISIHLFVVWWWLSERVGGWKVGGDSEWMSGYECADSNLRAHV